MRRMTYEHYIAAMAGVADIVAERGAAEAERAWRITEEALRAKVVTKAEALCVYASLWATMTPMRPFDERSFNEMTYANSHAKITEPMPVPATACWSIDFAPAHRVFNHDVNGLVLVAFNAHAHIAVCPMSSTPIDGMEICRYSGGHMMPEWAWCSNSPVGELKADNNMRQWAMEFGKAFIVAVQNPVEEVVESIVLGWGDPTNGSQSGTTTEPRPFRFVRKTYVGTGPTGKGSPKAPHDVIGHRRQLNSGKIVWVRPHRRGRKGA